MDVIIAWALLIALLVSDVIAAVYLIRTWGRQ